MAAFQAVILAAGQGTRMKSSLPKVLHQVAGKAMVDHVVDAARAAGAANVVVVVGHEIDRLREHFAGTEVELVQQEPRLGTGHAVQQAIPRIEAGHGAVVVLYGDAPLLQAATLRELVGRHAASDTQLSLLTATVPDAQRLGRIVRGKGGQIAIREWADASDDERACSEVNPGVYCFDRAWLLAELPRLTLSAKGEYYLTELVQRARRLQAVHTDAITSHVDIGVDTRQALAEAEQAMQRRLRAHWMDEGVTMLDASTVYLDSESCIGRDTVLEANTHIRRSEIGPGCVIGPGSRIERSRIGARCTIRESVLEEATLEDDVEVGPFSHLRYDTYVERGAKLGNYVEVKNARIGRDTQIHHFSYTGDAQVGQRVNIGAGTITCNYNSETGAKSETAIEDEVSTGSHTLLVAPVRLGRGAMTGSGSVVTHDVSAGQLAVGAPARPRRALRSCTCGHYRLAHKDGVCVHCGCANFDLAEAL
ncbi:MAG TPA: bifunctional UDP-N-acetylglucosamine diphosphorylase/glucosamine-1-phosphate N-acetyltransferase GlmU [Chloroflexota bacterium]|nr:bifunctional UDP-N-acetylglucosamine diphosphorylase/glucosamine-1-phosphate N-acetyltransferase GlmU [Chloroflexota bacterium]